MATSFAKTTLIGRLGADAEVDFTPNGAMNIKFNLAHDKWVPQGQEAKTLWTRVVIWGKLAETMANLIETHGALGKGDLVFVEGEPDVSAWVDRDGNARATHEVTAREIKLLASANRLGGQ